MAPLNIKLLYLQAGQGRTGHCKLVTWGSWLLSKQCKLLILFNRLVFFLLTPSWVWLTIFDFVVNLGPRYSAEMCHTWHQHVLFNVCFFMSSLFSLHPFIGGAMNHTEQKWFQDNKNDNMWRKWQTFIRSRSSLYIQQQKKHYFRVKNKCELHYILPSKKFGLKLKGNYTN